MSIYLRNQLEISNKVIEAKLCNCDYNDSQIHILHAGILDKDRKEIQEESRKIYETLLNSPPKEEGGRNALFGFYFQFLVAIDYLIEVIDGKWDFMAIEIHDDIVLCKEDPQDPKVRFVQVKTSKHPSLLYSDTELCDRTKKEFGEGPQKQKKELNNSWLDKLFINAELFKDDPEVKKEFQLVTNFTFHVPISGNSETKNINHYRENLFYGIDIKDDDPFFKKLKVDPHNLDGSTYNYQDRTGMSIRELLSRTHIFERVDHLSSFRDGVCKRLGDMMSRHIGVSGGATVLDEDVNWLIGEMCASCAARDDKLVLFIDREKAQEIVNRLLERATRYSEEFGEVAGNKKVIDNAFEKMILEMRNNPEAAEILEETAARTKEFLYRWIETGGTVLQLISRFHEWREEFLDFHARMHKSEREYSIYALTLMFVLLRLVNRDVKISSRYKSILVKEIITLFDKEYDLTFIKQEDYYSYEDVKARLKEIVTRLHLQSHDDILQLVANQPQLVIVHGNYDGSDDVDEFKTSKIEHISLEKTPSHKGLNKGESMSVVNYKFLMIPWYQVDSQYARLKQGKVGFPDFKKKIIEKWNQMCDTGETNDANV